MEIFQELISSMQAMSQLFDAGNKSIAKDMAVKLRVLFHDTGNSTSLLKQLGIKDSFQYLDTSQTFDKNNIFPNWGLVIAHLSTDTSGQTEAQYEAPLDNRPPSRSQKHAQFDTWWNNTVIKDASGATLSRSLLVNLLANKEGGAHVDPTPTREYRDITKLNSLLGIAQFSDDLPQSLTGKPLEESVRQVTYEVLKTFDEQPEVFHNF